MNPFISYESLRWLYVDYNGDRGGATVVVVVVVVIMVVDLFFASSSFLLLQLDIVLSIALNSG